MKAATGELNLTVITLIAIAAVIAFFWAMWPSIKGSITGNFENTQNRETRGETYNPSGDY